MERQKFEESFREAFDNAEVSPAESVWTNVELDLEKTTGGKMKRKLLFFQLLAAASMVFAMGVGSVYYLNSPKDVVHSTTDQRSNNVLRNGGITETQTDFDSKSSNPTTIITKTSKDNNNMPSQGVPSVRNQVVMSSQPALVIPLESSGKQFENELENGERSLSGLLEVKEPKLKISTPETDPGMILLVKLQDEEKKYQTGDPEVKEKVWASFGMGAGTFNPNTTSSSTSLNGFGAPASSSSNPSSGTSYSVGVSVGRKISKRVVLQGGVSYLSQNAAYTSSAASASGTKASMNEFAATSDNQIVSTNPYRVNSNLQYMSIPIQVGYIIIDRAFAVQLNGGISTDLFFQSTLTPEGNSLDKVTQTAGADSPYRTVNFSGLVGTELSYKVGSHYRIALNPGLRYSVNSIYKSEVATQISPITMDVALRFRYIF